MNTCRCGCGRPSVTLRGNRGYASHECRARAELAAEERRRKDRCDAGELADEDGAGVERAPLVADRPPESAVRARLGLAESEWVGV